ncbi:hypothetical protein AGLY_011809 [Aphis glycines]|uniref:Uncharacterized protein n=1 Tax=Aphis glycines TaxID=307491 RepID=A0A6G0TB87_APHGL|nr:hypothetical protein AGLY_011809 [Aphis glycines]
MEIKFKHCSRFLLQPIGSFCRCTLSSFDKYSHLNTKFQSNPPLRSDEAPMYWKLSILITSIIGHTTLIIITIKLHTSATRSKSGSSQFTSCPSVPLKSRPCFVMKRDDDTCLRVSCVGYWPIATQTITRQLIEFVTRIRIVAVPETTGGHVRNLVQFCLTIGQRTWRAIYVPVDRWIVDRQTSVLKRKIQIINKHYKHIRYTYYIIPINNITVTTSSYAQNILQTMYEFKYLNLIPFEWSLQRMYRYQVAAKYTKKENDVLYFEYLYFNDIKIRELALAPEFDFIDTHFLYIVNTIQLCKNILIKNYSRLYYIITHYSRSHVMRNNSIQNNKKQRQVELGRILN